MPARSPLRNQEKWLRLMSKDRLSTALSALWELVARLRGPGGCPWDAEQTDSDIKMYLLEEAHEVLDAIEKESPDDVREELGDLLFQIIFLCSLAEDRGEFDLADVMEEIGDKMIRRHPHVFGVEKVNSPSDVSQNWERIKRKEKGDSGSASGSLRDVPLDLPALLRAHRLSERASKSGFDWKRREEVWDKVKEEFDELSEVISTGDRERVGEEVGDLLFSLVNLTRHWDLNAEDVLRQANRKFIKRFSDMEGELEASGVKAGEATPEEMDRAWEKIKARDRRWDWPDRKSKK